MSINGRNKTDNELKEIIKSYNESELVGLKFGLLPAAKTPEDLTNHDVARLMELNPKGNL